MSDLLSVISASDKRRNLLIPLNDGPKEWDEIKQTLRVTSTGMLPQVKILEEEHLVEREGKLFSLTPLGKTLTAHMIPLVRTMDVFDRNKKFWQEHNLHALPTDLLMDISDLGDYRILETADEEIFGISAFLDNINKAKTLTGISHTVHPRFPDFFLNLARKNVKMSLILTPGVFKIIHAKYRNLLKEGLNLESAQVYVSKEDIKFSNITTDTYFSLSLFYNNGVFDSKHDIISYEPSALEWGNRLFSYYLERSEKVEDVG